MRAPTSIRRTLSRTFTVQVNCRLRTCTPCPCCPPSTRSATAHTAGESPLTAAARSGGKRGSPSGCLRKAFGKAEEGASRVPGHLRPEDDSSATQMCRAGCKPPKIGPHTLRQRRKLDVGSLSAPPVHSFPKFGTNR